MVPYLGKGEEGAERGLKLALTGTPSRSSVSINTDTSAGIKEGLFDVDVVAEYLLWLLNTRIRAESGMAECAPNRRKLAIQTEADSRSTIY